MSGILLAIAGNSYAALPANTSVPVVSGTAAVGSTLTSSTGTWTGTDPITFAYQWQRGTTNISGATSSSYLIQAGDAGSTLRCVVTATNVAGSTSANSANTAIVVAPSAPVNTSVPVISGTATVGATLSSSTGTWTGFPTPTYAYQWQRGTTNISGATSSSYTVQAADAGSTLRCVVTATNTQGSASANSANTAQVTQAPANTVAPTVAGRTEVAFVNAISLGTWTGFPTPTYTYQWQRNTSNISGATGSSYTLQAADVGNTVRCVVTATNSAGSSSATTASTASIYSPPMAYGTSYQGGYFAGQITTTGGAATHNLVISPKASGQTTAKFFNTAGTGFTSSSTDGPSNTATGTSLGSPACSFCSNLTIGGYTDWYLPSVLESNTLYRNLKPTTANNSSTNSGANSFGLPASPAWINSPVQNPTRTTATDFRSTGSQFLPYDDGLNDVAHWTSSAFFNGGREFRFATGFTGSEPSDAVLFVRAIRRVPV